MFAHKILDDIGKSEELFLDTTPLLNEGRIRFYKYLTALFLKRTPVAHTFYFKEATEIYNISDDGKPIGSILEKNQQYLKLPYKTTAFAWDIKNKARKFSLLHEQDEKIYINMADYHYDYSHFYIQPITLIINPGAADLSIADDSIFLDKTQPNEKYERGHYVAVAALVVDVLKLLHCKNIVTETIEPPYKLNRKRLKNKKSPILEYKILKVALPSKKIGKTSEGLSTRTTRLHFCRGHFKEYANEKKLFGKITGLFWWQPHIRGNKKQGAILKDYEII